MSRGLGLIQRWLFNLLHSNEKPMTFAEILARAYPAGSYERDMAKIIGGSKVGRVRSLRRTLLKMVRDDALVTLGSGRRGDPHRYEINGFIKNEALRHTNVGLLLLEARTGFPSRDEFLSWVKENFGLSELQAYDLMALAAIEKLWKTPPEAA